MILFVLCMNVCFVGMICMYALYACAYVGYVLLCINVFYVCLLCERVVRVLCVVMCAC